MTKLNMVKALNLALQQEMERDPDVLILGEDVGVDGGVFRVTDDLQRQFGSRRVIDSPLAEAAIVGTAVGMALYGLQAQSARSSSPASPSSASTRSRITSRASASAPRGASRSDGGAHAVRRRGARARASLGERGAVLRPHPRAQDGDPLRARATPARSSPPPSAIPTPSSSSRPRRSITRPRRRCRTSRRPCRWAGRASIARGRDLTLVAYGAMLRVAREAADTLGRRGRGRDRDHRSPDGVARSIARPWWPRWGRRAGRSWCTRRRAASGRAPRSPPPSGGRVPLAGGADPARDRLRRAVPRLRAREGECAGRRARGGRRARDPGLLGRAHAARLQASRPRRGPHRSRDRRGARARGRRDRRGRAAPRGRDRQGQVEIPSPMARARRARSTCARPDGEGRRRAGELRRRECGCRGRAPAARAATPAPAAPAAPPASARRRRRARAAGAPPARPGRRPPRRRRGVWRASWAWTWPRCRAAGRAAASPTRTCARRAAARRRRRGAVYRRPPRRPRRPPRPRGPRSRSPPSGSRRPPCRASSSGGRSSACRSRICAARSRSGWRCRRALIPHVTHFDRADITDLEAIVRDSFEAARASVASISPSRASSCSRRWPPRSARIPIFNASLDPGAGELILKRYYHLGRGGRHRARPHRAGAARRRPQARARDGARAGRARPARPRGQGRAGRSPRRHLHRHQYRRPRRHRRHPHHQLSRGRDPRAGARAARARGPRRASRAASAASRSRSPSTTAWPTAPTGRASPPTSWRCSRVPAGCCSASETARAPPW